MSIECIDLSLTLCEISYKTEPHATVIIHLFFGCGVSAILN